MESMIAVNTSLSLSSGEGRPFIDYSALPFAAELALGRRIIAPTWPIIIAFGFVSNIINIAVFLKAGVKENVTTLLLSLSISDLCFLTLIAPTMCGMVILAWAPEHPWPFSYRFLNHIFYWPAFTLYDLSSFISVSLGVMRCACVAMPLKFKLVFTRTRTIVWVVFLAVLAVALRGPVLSIFRVAYTKEPATNSSVPYVANVNVKSMSRINDVMNRGVVIWINYITMVTCVIVLSWKLYQAAQVRRSCIGAQTKNSSNQQSTEKSDSQRLQAKDLQVIQSVVLICSIYILSQLPFFLLSTARLANPKFTTDGNFNNLFVLINQGGLTLSYLNASINIFVYYNYNSRYRAIFLSLLSGNQATRKT